MDVKYKRPEECTGLKDYCRDWYFKLDGRRPNSRSASGPVESSNYYEEKQYIGKCIPSGTEIFVFQNFESVGYRTTTKPIMLTSQSVWNYNENIVYVVWSNENGVEISFTVLRCNITV